MAETQISYRNGIVVKEFIEVESGTGKRHRPKLEEAIKHCSLTGATLVVAKLDRLARNVHFITSLQQSKVKFFACDDPNASDFNIHILASIAEKEAKDISTRTKTALEAKKRRGAKLGASNPKWKETMERKYSKRARDNTLQKARAASAEGRKDKASAFLDSVRDILIELREQGLAYDKIAEELNNRHIKSPSGAKWSKSTTYRLLKHINAEKRK